MASIFTRIVNGEIPSYKIHETDLFYSFLDINPLQKGHTLVIPKKEVDRLFDLDIETYTGLMQYSKQIAEAIKKAFPCDRVGMAVIGLEVPHAHIHLVPINTMRDIDFTQPKLSLTQDEFIDCADKIRSFLIEVLG